MPTVIAAESFTAILPELMPLFRLHWQDLALYKDRMPLCPRVEIYEKMERAGELLMLTARTDGRLIGYFIGCIAPALHYATTIHGQTDIVYVHPEVRGRGIVLKLFLAAEEAMRARKVGIWHAGSKLGNPLHASMDRVLTWMGFAPTDLYYGKWLGD